MRTLSTLLITATFLFTPPSVATDDADWPNFRGPNHDGISTETGFKTAWSTPIPPLWEREIGSAFSSFACVDGKVYTCGTSGGKQVLLCLDADTGKTVWQRPIEKAYPEGQGGDGTRATPTVNDGRVYILGALGKLLCADAKTGQEIWSKQFGSRPTWGYSGSVLIDGNLAIASAGGDAGALVAFDKKSGKQVWKCARDPAGYATPYPFTFDGRRYIVGFMGASALIADAQTGKLVWRMTWKTSHNVNAASPIYHDGHLFISSGYNHGSTLLRLRQDGDQLATETVWPANRELRNKFQSCILHEGHLYSSDEQNLKCVELMTGKLKWQQRPREKHSTIIMADGHLIVLSERGELKIGTASPDGFEPLTTAKILSGKCWTVPTLYRGKLYARNMKRIVCFDLRESSQP